MEAELHIAQYLDPQSTSVCDLCQGRILLRYGMYILCFGYSYWLMCIDSGTGSSPGHPTLIIGSSDEHHHVVLECLLHAGCQFFTVHTLVCFFLLFSRELHVI
jgi:hypothetical protein